MLRRRPCREMRNPQSGRSGPRIMVEGTRRYQRQGPRDQIRAALLWVARSCVTNTSEFSGCALSSAHICIRLSQDGSRRSSRPRRFRCETTRNVRSRIPRDRITRALRANVKRTRRPGKRYIRERFAVNPNGIFSSISLSFSLFPPFLWPCGSSDASA